MTTILKSIGCGLNRAFRSFLQRRLEAELATRSVESGHAVAARRDGRRVVDGHPLSGRTEADRPATAVREFSRAFSTYM